MGNLRSFAYLFILGKLVHWNGEIILFLPKILAIHLKEKELVMEIKALDLTATF